MTEQPSDFRSMIDTQDFGGVFNLPWCPACQAMRFGTACTGCGLPLVIGQFVSLDAARGFAGEAHNEGYDTGYAHAKQHAASVQDMGAGS